VKDAQAGTPEPKQDDTPKGGTPDGGADGSSGDEQKWKEALVWKQKAEEFNKLDAEKKALEVRYAEMERLAYSRGAGQATDPQADLVARLREAAPYDDSARAALMSMEMAARASAETHLMGELVSVPQDKKAKVAALIRNSGYQMSLVEALNLTTDPDAASSRQRLAELEAENARLKERSVQQNAASPSFAVPASAASDTRDSLPWSEVQHTLKMGGDQARALRDKMDSGKLKVDYRN
jgi:hypothetical protein